MNTGLDCWGHCSEQQGPCSWCGSEGMCCTKKPGWTDTSNGCDGTFGGETEHECVLKPGKWLLSKRFLVCKIFGKYVLHKIITNTLFCSFYCGVVLEL